MQQVEAAAASTCCCLHLLLLLLLPGCGLEFRVHFLNI